MAATLQTQLAYLCLFTIMISSSACTQPAPTKPVATDGSQAAASTIEGVRRITAESLPVDLASVTPSTSLNELGADTLDFVELVMELEDYYQIAIPDEVIDGIAGTDIFQGKLKSVTIEELAKIVDDHR